MTRRATLAIFILALGTVVPGLKAQTTINRNTFLLEPNRPMVYLHVDHVGMGRPEENGQRHQRIWLELHNNCVLPISVRTYGSPSGDEPGAIGVMDRLAERKFFRIPSAAEEKQLGPKEMPPSTEYDVGAIYTIAPGESLRFSLPVNHFSKRWDINIPYQFDLPPGKGSRDENAWGGYPVMFLSYSLEDLPNALQQRLKAASGKPTP